LESLTQMSLLPIGDTHIAFERLGYAGPVIVFESGLGNDMRGWEAVARPLAAVAQIVLYDRPGIGRSGPRRGTEMLLASTVADELRTCLRAMDMPPPYLLVGHSLGVATCKHPRPGSQTSAGRAHADCNQRFVTDARSLQLGAD
jgi:pimeloyl-ACP methyl ester carboxylesterase